MTSLLRDKAFIPTYEPFEVTECKKCIKVIGEPNMVNYG